MKREELLKQFQEGKIDAATFAKLDAELNAKESSTTESFGEEIVVTKTKAEKGSTFGNFPFSKTAPRSKANFKDTKRGQFTRMELLDELGPQWEGLLQNVSVGELVALEERCEKAGINWFIIADKADPSEKCEQGQEGIILSGKILGREKGILWIPELYAKMGGKMEKSEDVVLSA